MDAGARAARPKFGQGGIASMSEQIYELLSHFNLSSLEGLPAVLEWAPRIMGDLHEALWERIYNAQYADPPTDLDIDQFRFLASASIRGDICQGCRGEKIESLGRFAALYSDETIVPLPLRAPEGDCDSESVRGDLLRTIESLIRLREPIQAGIIKPAVMQTAHCKHDADRAQELINLTVQCAEELAEEHMGQFEMLYEPNRGGRIPPILYIRGPEDYIEHGQAVIQYLEPPQWVAKSWRPDRDGRIRLPAAKVRKTGWINVLFQRIASDTSFHLALGLQRRAKLLTGLPGDTELLRGIDQEEPDVQNQRAILTNALSHALPFTNDLSLAQTVRLRKELRGAFEQYRFAITSIVRSHERDQNLTPRRAREIFGDELLPKIVALESQLSAERKRMKVKALATAGVISAMVGLGLFGFLPSSTAVGLLGGAASMKIADQVGDAFSPIPKVASNELYFPLKLKQRGRRRKT